ncbi:hypothetical protein Taro_013526 [Colocasia esculenta]|uniref:Pentatricopeptide repeat-containing protein n=1 Tax=Colocasia esculenta TaxID=4460 RepID=A0A843UMD9_COLES|nr:hypothetical protein [Colocasia esculenta]
MKLDIEQGKYRQKDHKIGFTPIAVRKSHERGGVGEGLSLVAGCRCEREGTLEGQAKHRGMGKGYLNWSKWTQAGYGQQGDSKKASDLLQEMQNSGIESDEFTYVSLLTAYVKSGDIETARQMFDKIMSPSLTSWNTIISGYCRKEMYKKAMELFRNMQFLDVQVDRTTLAVSLSACSGMSFLQFGKQIHAASTKRMLHLDMFVASGLVDMYSNCGHIEAAKQMRAMGMYPTEYSYASVISSCARLSSLSQGRQVHAQTEKDGFSNDIFVGSALIDMYSKCGNIEEARMFFDLMPKKNIVSWNEMIHGYAQNGYGDRSIELFEDMLRTEEKPDSVTFIAVLTACSHSGLVDKGMQFFNSMEKDHGILPIADHYTCIIDALGRSGRFGEIKGLIEKMPCKDDPISWVTYDGHVPFLAFVLPFGEGNRLQLSSEDLDVRYEEDTPSTWAFPMAAPASAISIELPPDIPALCGYLSSHWIFKGHFR